jgi:hypothetical protein
MQLSKDIIHMKIRFPFKFSLHLIILGLILVSSPTGYSQEAGSCAEKLKNAQALFARGQVEQVPLMLSECLKSGFSREEYLDAYKLLIQSYMFEDKLLKADSAMLEFLKKNPEYELSPTDHSSFVHLFSEFIVKPVIQVSFHIGTNIPYLTFIDPKFIFGEPGESTYNSELLNLYISLEAKFELNKKMDLNIETAYSQLSFINVEKIPNNGTTTYTETQRRIEIPLSMTYNFKRFGKLTPYGRLGFGPALSLGSIGTPEFKPSDINGYSLPALDIDRAGSRIKLDIFVQAGGGIKYKTRGGFFFTELRTNIGFFDQVIREGYSTEEQELARYFYADDDFNLNALNFTLGYTQIFYKPSKR